MWILLLVVFVVATELEPYAALGLLAGLTYATYSWVARHMIEQGVNSRSAMASMFGLAAALLLPTLARLTGNGQTVAVVAPPYCPYAPGWCLHGTDLARIEFIQTDDRQALWAMEQCLRSGSCAAVLGWPRTGDSRHLRRLQVAADTGRALAFVFRSQRHADNPSPAALRLDLQARPRPALRIRKCRGGQPPAQPVPLPAAWP